jgi:hypothetical protein
VPSRTTSASRPGRNGSRDRDFTPIEPVPDGALLDYARAYKAAAE